MSVILTDKIQPRTTGIALTVVGDTNVSGALTCTNFTASGNVTIGGTLTYEDVTNIDSVGLITARTGVRVTAGGVVINAGVSTFANTLNITGGEIKVGAAFSVSQAGVVTATSYYGDGSNLSNITSTTINNNADNRLITGSGTANTLEGESNLTFDGNNLAMSGTGVFTITRNSRTLTLEGNYGNEGHPAIKTSSGHNLRIFTSGNNERLRITSGGDVEIDGTAAGVSSVTWDASANSLIFKDTVTAKFGDGGDFRLWHDGSHGYLDNDTGWLYVGSDNHIFSNKEFDETYARFLHDGAVELYHNNVKTFETSSEGIIVQGTEGGGGVIGLYADEGDDNADKWQLVSENNGTFQIKNYSSGSWENVLQAIGDGAVELYHNNAKKFETSNDGTVTTGISTATDFSGDYPLSNRRINMNGDFKVCQRATSQASITSNGNYVWDRWSWSQNGATVTLSQSTTVPTGKGFKYSAKMETTSTVGSIAAGNTLTMGFAWEGQDLTRLKYGNAAAESLRMSFYARASETGVFVTTLKHGSRIISKRHTVADADTWVKYYWEIPGDTSTALTNTDNSAGMTLGIYISSGSNTNSGGYVSSWGAYHSAHMGSGNTLDLLTNTGTFYITGVQFEVGETFTPYEHISYGEELAKCKRYYQTITAPIGEMNATEDIGIGRPNSSTEVQLRVACAVEMRATPAVESTTGSQYFRISNGNLGGDKYLSNAWIINNMSPTGGFLYTQPDDNLGSYIGESATVQSKSTSARLALKSDL